LNVNVIIGQGTETFKSRPRECFGEHIGKVIGAGDSTNVNSAIFGMFVDIMKTDVNVFAMHVMGGVISQ
jgi:hypothetical protein